MNLENHNFHGPSIIESLHALLSDMVCFNKVIEDCHPRTEKQSKRQAGILTSLSSRSVGDGLS
jgi:hypothetical protein